jgi:hypothetical protein
MNLTFESIYAQSEGTATMKEQDLTSSQLGELQALVSGGVSTALPKVAGKFGNLEAVLKALKGEEDVLARNFEMALEQAINRMLVLNYRRQGLLAISGRHEPSKFYRSHGNLWVHDDFKDAIASKAKPVKAGTKFALDIFEIRAEIGLTNEEIEDAIHWDHLLDETAVCAIFAEMIGIQPYGRDGDLEVTGMANLVFTASCVVSLDWDVDDRQWSVVMWPREHHTWPAGTRVIAPSRTCC